MLFSTVLKYECEKQTGLQTVATPVVSLSWTEAEAGSQNQVWPGQSPVWQAMYYNVYYFTNSGLIVSLELGSLLLLPLCNDCVTSADSMLLQLSLIRAIQRLSNGMSDLFCHCWVTHYLDSDLRTQTHLCKWRSLHREGLLKDPHMMPVSLTVWEWINQRPRF